MPLVIASLADNVADDTLDLSIDVDEGRLVVVDDGADDGADDGLSERRADID